MKQSEITNKIKSQTIRVFSHSLNFYHLRVKSGENFPINFFFSSTGLRDYSPYLALNTGESNDLNFYLLKIFFPNLTLNKRSSF